MLLFTMQMFRCWSVIIMSHQTVDCDKRATHEWRLQLLPGSRAHFCRGRLVSAAQHGAPPPNPSIPAGCHARKKGPLLHNRYGIKMIEKCVSLLQGSQRSRKIPGLCQGRYGKEGALGALCPGTEACILLQPPTGPSWLLANPRFMVWGESFSGSK